MKSPDSLSPVEAARKILEARNNEQSSELVEGVDENLEATETEVEVEESTEEVDIENFEEEDEVDEAYLKASKDKTLDTKSVEDTKLYDDGSGKGAKIATDKGTEGKDKKNKSSVANYLRSCNQRKS